MFDLLQLFSACHNIAGPHNASKVYKPAATLWPSVYLSSAHTEYKKKLRFNPKPVPPLHINRSQSAPLNADVVMVSDQRPNLNPGQHSREHLGFRV